MKKTVCATCVTPCVYVYFYLLVKCKSEQLLQCFFNSITAMDPRLFYGSSSVAVRELPNGNDSEESDLSDEESALRPQTVLAPDSDEDSVSLPTERIVIPDSDDALDSDADDVPLCLIRNSHDKRSTSSGDLKNLKWRPRNMEKFKEEVKFEGHQDLPEEIQQLSTPIDYFKYFVTDEILQYVVEQSNLYATQSRPTKPSCLTKNELEQFIGMTLYMSVIQLPATRHYWNGRLGHESVSEVMDCNRWEEIKRFIHFNDNTTFVPAGDPGHDKLHKIRPLLERIRERLGRVPKEEFLAVDEQIIPTKCRSSIKQYNAKKPHKWGYKAFVLSCISGFSYDFEIFSGAQSNVVPSGTPDLGASSNVVVRLSQSVPRNVNHKIFFDNWLTSVPLQVYLKKEGILSLGTVRATRIPNCDVPTESEMKREGRGSMKEKVAMVDDVELSLVTWYDNKTVNTLWTYAGSRPTGEKRRYFRKEKTYKTMSILNFSL